MLSSYDNNGSGRHGSGRHGSGGGSGSGEQGHDSSGKALQDRGDGKRPIKPNQHYRDFVHQDSSQEQGSMPGMD